MLPKKNRLSSADLRHFHGRRFTTQSLHAISRQADSPTKFAVLIKKSLVNKAHDRNRLKRLLMAALVPSINQAPHHHTLLILQSQGIHSSDPDLLTDLEKVLQQINSTVNY